MYPDSERHLKNNKFPSGEKNKNIKNETLYGLFFMNTKNFQNIPILFS